MPDGCDEPNNQKASEASRLEREDCNKKGAAMSKRAGWADEYRVKRMLSKRFGQHNVLKIAGSQNVPDYLCLDMAKGRVFGFEVKGTKGKKYYPTNHHDKPQFHLLAEWSEKTKVPVFYIIVTRVKVGKGIKVHEEEVTLKEYGLRYCGVV